MAACWGTRACGLLGYNIIFNHTLKTKGRKERKNEDRELEEKREGGKKRRRGTIHNGQIFRAGAEDTVRMHTWAKGQNPAPAHTDCTTSGMTAMVSSYLPPRCFSTNKEIILAKWIIKSWIIYKIWNILSFSSVAKQHTFSLIRSKTLITVLNWMEWV